jgi:hypothetical protein
VAFRCRLSVVVLIACVALVAPAVADATLTWTAAPQTLSTGEFNASQPQVAFDAQGNVTMVWVESDGTHSSIHVATGPPGAYLNVQPTPISSATAQAVDPQIAVAPNGSATVVWEQVQQASPPRYDVYRSDRPAGGTFGAAQNMTATTSESVAGANVAMDAAGDTLIAWVDGNDFLDSTYVAPNLQTMFRPAGGTFTAPLPRYATTGPDAFDEGIIADVAVKFDAQGNALIAWDGNAQSSNQDRFSHQIHAIVRDANGTYEAAQLVAHETSLFEQEIDLGPVAISNGTALVSWVRQDVSYAGAQVAERPAGSSTWTPDQTLAGEAVSNSFHFGDIGGLAFDPSGNALAATNGFTAVGTGSELSFKPAAGTSFGPPVATSAAGVSTSDDRVGIDATGAAVVTHAQTVGADPHTFAASRTPGAAGTLDAFQDLGPFTETFGSPTVLGVAPAGNTIAASILQGANDALQIVAGATPTPGAPVVPPPSVPPPQPEPPVPSAIQLARPMATGDATVVTVSVTGDIDRLVWSVPGNSSAVGRVVGGVLQRSVRFRAPHGAFGVKVTAIGPGGSKTFSRSFSGPREPSDDVGQKLLQHVHDAVVATGTETVLTGTSARCGPVTIDAGDHELSGCFKPAQELENIPFAQRGVLVPLAAALKADVSNAAVMRRAVELTDGYVASGTVLLDGTWPVVPSGGASIVAYLQADALTSSNASLTVGGIGVGGTSSGFNLHLDTSPGPISLGSIPPPPGNHGIGGFPFAGDFTVSLQKTFATIRTTIRLGDDITFHGVPIQAPVTLTASPSAISVPPGLSVGPYNADFGVLPLQRFIASYQPATDSWVAQASACLLDQCIDLIPPGGEIDFAGGKLVRASATHTYDPPGKPLAPGVFLENIGAGFGLDPSRLFGHGRIGIGQFVKVDGHIVYAAPSTAAPYFLRHDEVGDSFPPAYYKMALTRPLIAMGADVILTLPVIGDTTLGGGYLLYEFPGFISVGGSASLNVLGIITYSGSVSGQYDVLKQAYNLHGDIRACLAAVHGICAGSVANFSRGPNLQGGAGGCLKVGPVNIGGGVQWSHPQTPIIWPLDGCKWSRFKIDINPSRSLRAAGGTGPSSYSVTVKAGAPSQAMRLDAAAEAPRVTVTGPGGQSLSSTDAGLDYSSGGKLRIVRYDGIEEHFTTVGFEHAAPGKYTIALQPLSAPVTAVSTAADPAAATVSGRVTGQGTKRMLHYSVVSRPDQTVAFSDVSAGDSHVIGTINGGGRGTIAFTAAPGRSARKIVAQFSLNGLAAETKTVTRFTPVSAALGAPRRLTVRRGKPNKLAISWAAVPDAVSYELAVTTSSGRQVFSATKRHSARVSGIDPSVSGKVTIRAVAPLRQGRLAQRTFKRAAAAKRRFHRLPKCKVAKKKVACR